MAFIIICATVGAVALLMGLSVQLVRLTRGVPSTRWMRTGCYSIASSAVLAGGFLLQFSSPDAMGFPADKALSIRPFLPAIVAGGLGVIVGSIEVVVGLARRGCDE
jgi:hypothetical protein